MEILTKMFVVCMISIVWLSGTGDGTGTKWAFLIAGSRGYKNYRHQAGVCHAYHILKDGGLKDENIIVMMYDDIAFNEQNSLNGYIFNKPNSPDVYAGVPKDYTGKDVNVQNIYSILRGDTTYLTGGSGKVLTTGFEDTIFIYIAGHGSHGYIDIIGSSLWGREFVEVLIQKRDSSSCKKMVIYVEACESGAMFDPYLNDDSTNTGIYVTTASSGEENSHAKYCFESDVPVCMGDWFSLSWMEDSESHNRSTRTFAEQYSAVSDKVRVSTVLVYGDMNIQEDFLSTYMGANTTA